MRGEQNFGTRVARINEQVLRNLVSCLDEKQQHLLPDLKAGFWKGTKFPLRVTDELQFPHYSTIVSGKQVLLFSHHFLLFAWAASQLS